MGKQVLEKEIKFNVRFWGYILIYPFETEVSFGLVAQLVRAPPCHGGGRRFESDLGRWFLNKKSDMRYGILAQLGEHLPYKQRVIGSSPIGPIFGRFPEWPKGTDCKSAANCFGGSNPPPSIFYQIKVASDTNLVLQYNMLTRGGAVWKLVGLITRRS